MCVDRWFMKLAPIRTQFDVAIDRRLLSSAGSGSANERAVLDCSLERGHGRPFTETS